MSDSTATPPLPELQQAQFDAAELETLLRDIGACASITEIIPKYTATGHVPENAVLTLEGGRQLLLGGAARAVQFRYRYQQADWWDTVMALPGGQFRLVRIQHHFDTP
ncbi:MAG: hypothetical protein IPK22_27165 [Verrucomicrobiaceae bacterium]|jgi:hypothetical protein|nr:hypothetical protein [Verrucomicrobiaceae bacterium]